MYRTKENWDRTKFGTAYKTAVDRLRKDVLSRPDFDPATRNLLDADTLVVFNKCDIVPEPERQSLDSHPALTVSVKTGAGMAALEARLAQEVAARLERGPGEAARCAIGL